MKKIVRIYFREGTTLDVLFNDGIVKRYDALSLANYYPQLNELKDRKLFLSGKICGTSGVKWTDELDLEGQTIYDDGQVVKIDEKIDTILLGFKIKEERIKQGLSQQELARLTGIDQGDISKIENGTANPTIATLSKICSCLNKKLNITLSN